MWGGGGEGANTHPFLGKSLQNHAVFLPQTHITSLILAHKSAFLSICIPLFRIAIFAPPFQKSAYRPAITSVSSA